MDTRGEYRFVKLMKLKKREKTRCLLLFQNNYIYLYMKSLLGKKIINGPVTTTRGGGLEKFKAI